MNRRLAADIGWLWAGYLGRSLAYLAILLILTRELGAAGFGQVSLFMAVGLGVAAIAGSWPFMALPMLVNKGRGLLGVLNAATRTAAVATFACLAIAIPLSAVFISSATVTLSALVIFAIALVGLQGVYGVFQAQGRMRQIAAVQTSERLLTLVLLAATLILWKGSVGAAEAILASGSSIVLLVLIWRFPGRRKALRGEPEDFHWRELTQAVGPMGVVNACAYGVAWLDVFILAAMRGDTAVGVYALAYQIYTFVLQLASLWIVATLPRHARSSHHGISPVEQLPVAWLEAGVRVWGSLVVLGCIVVSVVLTAVFGQDFSGAARPLAILLCGATLLAAYLAVTSVLIAAGEVALILKVSLICVSINLLLDVALIPLVGLLGPAIATTAQTLVGAGALLNRVFDRAQLLRLLVASAPPAVCLGILAIDPTDLRLLALATITAVLSSIPAARWLRAERPWLSSGEPLTGPDQTLPPGFA